MNKMSIKKGDEVVVLSGKDKGKKGKVIATLPKSGKVVVEKINMVSRHTKPRQQGQEGGKAEGQQKRNASFQHHNRPPV